MPVICFSMSTTRVCGPGYWSRSSTELQLYSPDGQSKQAWVSEMFYLSISHELSEIVSFHSLSELVMRTLAVILFTAQSNCQQIYITALLWDTYIYALDSLPFWVNVLLCIIPVRDQHMVPTNMIEYGIWKQRTGERSKKKLTNNGHFKWFNMNKWYLQYTW